jgi:prepilin-type N-terminal cleavage/methylation domain-containing protein
MEDLTPAPPRRRATRGFSLIEVLIAMLLLTVVVLGIIPLFSRSIANNNSGREASQASNHGRSRVEELASLPLDRVALRIPDGADDLTDSAVWVRDDREWKASPDSGDLVLWNRTTTVRQFSVSDFYDFADDLRLQRPLPGGTDPTFVHLREVVVEVESARDGGPLFAGKELRMSSVRAF